MGKSAPQPPPPPDPKQVAGAQTATNVSTALANAYMGNANETNPYGSVNYSIDHYTNVVDPNSGAFYDIPTFQRDVTLNPAQQKMLDLQNQTGIGLDTLANNQTQRLNGVLSSPFDATSVAPSRVNSLEAPGNNFTTDAQATQQAIMSRLSPEMDRQRAALETQLTNQGYQRGSAAFNTQMDQFGRQQNDANQQAVLAGYQQEQNNFNQTAQAAQFQNTARQQAVQEALTQRNQPINEISALMSGGQVSMPQFAPYQFSPMTPAPYGQYAYQSANLAEQNYQSQMQSYNAGISGMYGLGSSLMGLAFMSDRRLKKNVKDLGIKLANGAKLYAYEYLGEAKRRVGVMAQEVLGIRPEAVFVVNGHYAVDYGRVF